MAMVAAVGSLVPMAMDSALRMDPEETKYLACPTIADDSLAYEDTDVSQGGRKSATASGRLRGKFGVPSVILFVSLLCPFWRPTIVSCRSSQPRELLLLMFFFLFLYVNRWWVNAFDPIFHFSVPTLDI